MCKIFAMTNMEKVVLNKKFIETVRNQVCKLSDKDGFGYAVLSNKGKIGGERTMRPMNFKPLVNLGTDKVIDKLPITLKSSNSFGQLDLVNAKSFIAHARLSTNNVTLENTHPFTNGEVALIHNGVVHDETGDVTKSLTTTCDSEILLRYWEQGGIKAVEENVSGYYAMAILDKKGKLHIVRDDKAMLYISYCRTVNSYIIATTADIIKGVAKKMKWSIENPEELHENIYAVFDGNEILSHEKIDPLGMVRSYMSGKAARALGWENDDYDYGERHYGYAGNYPATYKGESAGRFQESDPAEEAAPSYKEIIQSEDAQRNRVAEDAGFSEAVEGSGSEYQSEYETSRDDMPDPEYADEEPQDLVDALEGVTKLKRYA